MRTAIRAYVHGLALGLAALGMLLGMAIPAAATSGHWKFIGYATKPSQSELDAISAAQDPTRVYEAKASGAFQPAESGAGTINLSFKTDDIDRHVYLTTLTFSFTTGVEMRTLTPGQELHFKGVLQMGGNAQSKAIPAHGSGRIAVDSGDWFVSTDAAIDQGASSEGVFKVFSGGPGSRMMIYAAGHLESYGGLGVQLEMYYAWVEGPAGNAAPPPDTHTANQPGVEDPVADVTWYVCSYPNPNETCGDWLFHSNGTIEGIVNGQLVWSGHWAKLGHYTYQYDFFYSGVTLHTWVRFSDPDGAGHATLLTGYPDASMSTPYRKGQRK